MLITLERPSHWASRESWCFDGAWARLLNWIRFLVFELILLGVNLLLLLSPLLLLEVSLLVGLLLLLLQEPLSVLIPLELADVIRILSEHSATLFLLSLVPSYLTRMVNIILVAMAVTFGGISFRIQVQPLVVHHKLELLAYLDLHIGFEAL